MEKLKIKDIYAEAVEYFRNSGPKSPNVGYFNRLMQHDIFQKVPSRQIWRRQNESLKLCVTFSLCSLCYPEKMLTDEAEQKLWDSIQDTSVLTEDKCQQLRDIFEGPVVSDYAELSYLIACEFFNGNMTPMQIFLQETLPESLWETHMREAVTACKEAAFQIMCMGWAEDKYISENIIPMSEMLDPFNESSIELAEDLIKDRTNIVPISEGRISDTSKIPAEQLKSSEKLCKMRPNKIMLGAILLYLDHQDIASTTIMGTLLDYCAFHMPIGGVRSLMFMSGLMKNLSSDSDGVVDIFQEPLHLPCYYSDKTLEQDSNISPDSLLCEQFCMTPAALLASYTGFPFYDNFTYSKSLEDWFVDHGVSREKAHDYAIIGAAISSARTTDVMTDDACHSGECKPESVDVSAYEEQIASLTAEKEKLEEQVKMLQQKLNKSERQLRMANYELNKRQDTNSLNEQVQMLTWKNQELTDALESITAAVAEEPVEPQNDVKFPYFTNKRIVLFGGHDTFRAALQKLLPDIRLMQPTELSMDVSPIRNADLLCLQPNKCNHPQYWNAVSTAKTNDVPCIHLRYANAELCARAIVEKLEAMTA